MEPRPGAGSDKNNMGASRVTSGPPPPLQKEAAAAQTLAPKARLPDGWSPRNPIQQAHPARCSQLTKPSSKEPAFVGAPSRFAVYTDAPGQRSKLEEDSPSPSTVNRRRATGRRRHGAPVPSRRARQARKRGGPNQPQAGTMRQTLVVSKASWQTIECFPDTLKLALPNPRLKDFVLFFEHRAS
jgi:hypothetical protein